MATKWDVIIAHVDCDRAFAKDLKGRIIHYLNVYINGAYFSIIVCKVTVNLVDHSRF